MVGMRASLRREVRKEGEGEEGEEEGMAKGAGLRRSEDGKGLARGGEV